MRTADAASRPAEGPAARPAGRAPWQRHLYRWHWISSAVSLIGMVLFAVTGITLNHAADLPASPQVTERRATLPPALRHLVSEGAAQGQAALPADLRAWVRREMGVRIGASAEAEWSRDEVHLTLPRPGGDAWLAIDRETGEAEYELTTRGVVALLNDLHKGRHAGLAWSLFLDVFAAACLVFCLTGLWLLALHARARPSTWPLVGLGLVLPLIVAILFIH